MISVANPLASFWTVRIEGGPAQIIPSGPKTEEEKNHRARMEKFLTNEGGCWAELSDISFLVPSWRDLEGQRATIDVETGFPILPGNAGNFFYATEHNVPVKNKLAFGRRRGNGFKFSWSFVAEAFPGDEGLQVEVETTLMFRKLSVQFLEDTSTDVKQAERIAFSFAQPEDLELAKVEMPDCVSFRVKENVA
jgi:hypothetical protein